MEREEKKEGREKATSRFQHAPFNSVAFFDVVDGVRGDQSGSPMRGWCGANICDCVVPARATRVAGAFLPPSLLLLTLLFQSLPH